ncbi:unnamed protein product [Mytilus edulis]|uniref:B box-type domain-containing protein n=1 Tax=Mytilus edulis TaxID=6550 RepID=A0A8S3SKX8_MYTED|nr:unnamed protein product [Mytilus edulis]
MKTTTSHSVISIDEYLKLKPEIALHPIHCNKHDRSIDLYCINHDMALCRLCMTENHRGCLKMLPIEDAAQNFKKSLHLKQTLESLESMREMLQRLAEDRLENISDIEQSEKLVKEKISTVRDRLIKHIEALHEQIQEEVSSIVFQKTLQLKRQHNDILEQQETNKLWTKNIETMIAMGSDMNLFLMSQKYRDVRKGQEVFVNENQRQSQRYHISYHETENILGSIKSFGYINVTTTQSKVAMPTDEPMPLKYFPLDMNRLRMRDGSALPPLPLSRLTNRTKFSRTTMGTNKTLKPENFRLKKKIEVPKTRKNLDYVWITGIQYIPTTNKILVCNRNDNHLYLYDDYGRKIKEVPLNTRPWGITLLMGTQSAVVTLPEIKAIQFINIMTFAPAKTANVGTWCAGITNVSNQLIIGCDGCFKVLDASGNLKHTVPVNGGRIWYIHACINGTIVYSDTYKVYGVTIDGGEIFKYESEDMDCSEGITTDYNDNIYVAGRDSNDIHQLSLNGELLRIILSKSDGLVKPYALHFRKKARQLYVSFDGKFIAVYDVKNSR